MKDFFSPNSSEDQKTAPNIIQRSDANQSQIIGGDADVDHSQIIGKIYPHPPGFRHPWVWERVCENPGEGMASCPPPACLRLWLFLIYF